MLVEKAYHVPLARRHVERYLASRLALKPSLAEDISLALTEALTNVLKHAERAKLTYVLVDDKPDSSTFKVVVDDWGPGIADLELAQQEGVSTAGTLGLGFSLMRKHAHDMELENTEKGLRVRLSWNLGRIDPAARNLEHASLVRPMPGESVGGDLVHNATLPDGSFLSAVFDVLGHGPAAHRSAMSIGRVCQRFHPVEPEKAPCLLLQRVASELNRQRLRSAVAAVGLFDPSARRLHLCGVGNITVALALDGRVVLPAFYGGVLGPGARRLKRHLYAVKDSLTWAMASDGLSSGWTSLLKKSSGSSARALVRSAVNSYYAGRDDVGLMVVKWKSS